MIKHDDLDINEIDNDHMYLLSIIRDCSSSMESYISYMEQGVENFKRSIYDANKDNEILVSFLDFNSNLTSVGFRAVSDIPTTFAASGCTALYDSIMFEANHIIVYANELNSVGIRTKAGIVIFADGVDNLSSATEFNVRNTINDLLSKDITVSFIGFGECAHGIAHLIGIQHEGDILETDKTPYDLLKCWDMMSRAAIKASTNTELGNRINGGFFKV